MDGVVWRVDYKKTNCALPRRLGEMHEHEAVGVFTAEMLGRAAPSLETFEALAAHLGHWLQQRPDLAHRSVRTHRSGTMSAVMLGHAH